MNKRFNRKPKKYEDYKDFADKGSKGNPDKEQISDKSLMIGKKSLRNLPKSSYSLKADPYTNANPTSKPYAILAAPNGVMGGRYGGLQNIDGGTASAYINSNSSRFLSSYDCMEAKIKLNYRYLPIEQADGGRGLELVNKMRMAISDADSILKSTTFYEQPFLSFGVITDLPMGSAEAENMTENGAAVKVYTDATDTIYATAIIYQIIVQTYIKAFLKFNAFRTSQGEMMRMSYDRETPALNDLFSLLNKKAFLSKIDSLSLTIESEYVDVDWKIQAAMLTNLKSRRSESMTDPLIEITSTYAMPTIFKIVMYDNERKVTGTIFDLAELNALTTNPKGLQGLSDTWETYLSCRHILHWARNGATETTQSIYNSLVNTISDFTKTANYFKTKMADFRAAIDTLKRTNIVRWEKNDRMFITKDTDMQISNLLLVNNIVQEAMAGPAAVQFNDTTKRLRSWAMWNMYYGIPEYANWQGGIFITLSGKDLSNITDDYIKDYLPVAFKVGSITSNSNGIICLNRSGKQAIVENRSVVGSSEPQFNRLFPLSSQSTLTMQVPTIKFDNAMSEINKSMIIKALLSVFGYCSAQKKDLTSYENYLDTDLVSIYDYEVEDITSDVISYCKYFSPFRGSETNESSLGFIGLYK